MPILISLGLYPQYPEIWRVVHNDVSVVVTHHDQTKETISYKKGDLVQADFRNAHLDVSFLILLGVY
jgi:hypothetical protein